jgi:hypothetical protein
MRAWLSGFLGLAWACSAAAPSTPAEVPTEAGKDATMREATPPEAATIEDRAVIPPGDEDAAVASDGPPDVPDATDGTEEAASDVVDARPPTSYACTLVIGINATGEWYKQGFEQLVDNARWELMQIHNGFIEKWADPNDAYWATAIDSPCTKDAKAPDRIVFVLSNFDYTTIEEWYPPLLQVLKNLQVKYPSAQNVELTTWVRAPGNLPCPQAPANRSTISAGEDQAIAKATQEFPGRVTAAPKFEAHSCSEYTDNPPHPTTAGGTAWAKMIAAHYNATP